MSYFGGCAEGHTSLSPDQVKIVRTSLASGNRRDLAGETRPDGPAAVAHGPDALHVFARGDDRVIWHNWWTSGGGWNGWVSDIGAGTFAW